MTTAQPGRNSEDFLRALLKVNPENAEKVRDATPEDDEQQPDDRAEDDSVGQHDAGSSTAFE